MKKEYKKASMEMVNLSDDDLDSVSGGVGNTEETNQKTKEEIREDCFEYGFMGMCSGYEQQPVKQEETNQETKEEIREDCFGYEFMGMCSGYELAGNLNQTSTQEASENPSAAPDSQQTSSTGPTFYEDEL